MTKDTDKELEEVMDESEDGIWPMSSFVPFSEYCSLRLMCNGCWAETKSFDDYPCNICQTTRPSHYSKKQPVVKKIRKISR
jgi:hypothetical protein